MMKYDYLIVGSGLYGSVFAHEACKANKRCLVVEKRSHIGGNIYTENIAGIHVHKYGAHIFHTNNEEVWLYVNRFARFNNYINSPIASYKGRLYNLPFNMNTFYQIWGVKTPTEALSIINNQRKELKIGEPKNLEEQAISLVGKDIYNILIKGYTEKQWGRDCRDLPPSIIKRLPVRFVFDNNYFNAKFQGIPEEGYTRLVENMLDGIEVELNVDFLQHRDDLSKLATKIIFTGPIDAYYQYIYGNLNYRTVRFETKLLPIPNFQGAAVVNYTDREIPFTRIIEHKHFNFKEQLNTVISKEYPAEWSIHSEPYYPINDVENNKLYERYKKLSQKSNNVHFGGRLGAYRYYDMDQVIAEALRFAKEELSV